MPRIAGHYQRLGRVKEPFFPESHQKKNGPADTLVLNFAPPKLEK
jgi:hypothetical protein